MSGKIKKIALWSMTFIIVLGFSLQNVWAQSKVVSVEVQGNRGVDSAIILNEVYFSKGKPYSRALVSEDVKRIFKLGFFDEVNVDKVGVPGGVKLIFIVKEKPAIDGVAIEGNKKIKKPKLKEVITVKPNQPPNNKEIAKSISNIKQLYAEEGYPNAVVETKVQEKDGKRLLVFKILEKEGSTVREVRFEGNTVFSTGKLKRMIKTKKKSIISFLTGSGKFREDILERDAALLTYNYLNKGYLRVRVGTPRVEFSEEKKGLVITFYIDEGKQYRVGDVKITGDVITTEEEILSKFDTLKGNVYSQKILEGDLSKIQAIYGNQGYAFVNIVPQPSINDDTLTADINVNIQRGQKVFIEKINITGNTITRDKVIRRELRIVENSLYNESLVRLSKRKLDQLGFFETIDISTPRGSADDRLVLNINVKEKPTGTFSVGAGFSSAESFLFTASVAKNNFWGLGISGNVSAEVSGRRQQFSGSLTDPFFLDTRNIFSVNAYRISTRFNDFRRNAFGGNLSIGRRLFDFTTYSIGYKIEDLNVDDFDAIVPEFFRLNTDGLASVIQFNIRRDTRNSPVVTTKGSYLSLNAEYAGKALLGNINYFRLLFNGRYYYPLWKNSVLRFNLRVGWIKSLEDAPVPLFERFFTGGINSLRGYELRSVGPRITIPAGITGPDQDFVYGGNKLLVINFEYEFPIYDAGGFRGVVFFDAGNSYAEDEAFNPLKVRMDFGGGVRWMSPFGPLRFEWGFPIRRRPGERRSVFNFTIGSFF